jgi:hypothetical protein
VDGRIAPDAGCVFVRGVRWTVDSAWPHHRDPVGTRHGGLTVRSRGVELTGERPTGVFLNRRGV